MDHDDGALHEGAELLNAAFLVVSHEMAIIRKLCPQVTVMMEGKVAAQGTLDEVARLPAVVAGYLGKALE